MAYYTPPAAPRPGQMTVDSSRFQPVARPPIPDPFQKAYDIKKQALEMKGMEREEKASISQEVANTMTNDIFAMGDDASKFDPDAILQFGKFNEAELKKRQFTSEMKLGAWKKYQSNAKKAGGVADRMTFETAWKSGKGQEDDRILNEMWMDVQSNKMSDKEFGLATRNETFRDMWKDMSTEKKEVFQVQLENAGMDRYTPGYETFWEGATGTGPTDERQDMFTSPAALGAYAVVPGSAILASPKAREFIAKPFKAAYGVYGGGNMRALKGEVSSLIDLKRQAKNLGYNPRTGKIGVGKSYAGAQYQIDRKALSEFSKSTDGKDLKKLQRLAKGGQPHNEARLKELQEKFDKLSGSRKSSKLKLDEAKKAVNRQQAKIRDLKSKIRSGGNVKGGAAAGAQPSGTRGFKGFRGEKVPLGRAAMKGLAGGMFAGYLTGAGSRMILGEDSKGAKLTNEAIEGIGTQAGMGSGQIAMMKKIKNVISKKGYKWALKKIAKKGGLKLAMGVGAKAILGTAGGVMSGGALTAVSAALLVKDLGDIALILAE